MDFNNLKNIDTLLKVAYDPRHDEGLGKGSLNKQQLLDLKQTYIEDAKSVPKDSPQYIEFVNKVKAINEQLDALEKLEQINWESESFASEEAITKIAIDTEELSLPTSLSQESSRPANLGYGMFIGKLKNKLEEIIGISDDSSKVRELAYDAITLLEHLIRQESEAKSESISSVAQGLNE